MANEALNQAIDNILMLGDADFAKFLDPAQRVAALEPLYDAISQSSKDKSRFPQDARARGLSMLHAALILLASKVTSTGSPDEQSLAVGRKFFEYYKAFNVNPEQYLLTFVFKDLYGEIEAYHRIKGLPYTSDLKKELLSNERTANMMRHAYSKKKVQQGTIVIHGQENEKSIFVYLKDEQQIGYSVSNAGAPNKKKTLVSFLSDDMVDAVFSYEESDRKFLNELNSAGANFNMPIDEKRIWRVNGFSAMSTQLHVHTLNQDFSAFKLPEDSEENKKYDIGKKALDELNYLFSITNPSEIFANNDSAEGVGKADVTASVGKEAETPTVRPGKMNIHPLSNWEKYPHTSVRSPLNESKNHNDAVAKSISMLLPRHRGVVLRQKFQKFREVCENTKADLPLDNVSYTPHSRNPEVMASCYYVLAKEGIGQEVSIESAHAHGRDKVFFMHLGAMVIYHDKYSVLPTFDDNITNRLNFLDIMADLYADDFLKNEKSFVATNNIDDDLAMFPPDFVDHLHINYPCLFEIKEPKINKTYLIGFSAFAAGLAVAGVACYGEIDRWKHLETVKDKTIGDDFLSDLDTTGGLMLSAAVVVFVAAALYNYWSQTQRVNEAMPASPMLVTPVETETFHLSYARSFKNK